MGKNNRIVIWNSTDFMQNTKYGPILSFQSYLVMSVIFISVLITKLKGGSNSDQGGRFLEVNPSPS